MDFFESQDVARRQTVLLVIYFILAVVLIIASVYLVFAVAFLYAGDDVPVAENPALTLWDAPLFLAVAAGTLAIIGGGSLYRMVSLASGGHVVAEMLGGRPLDADTRDPDERRVLNVVEEMAIASGTPVPPVYLLENETGINAFAAGYRPTDAVIGVTRGCVRHLSRDELQGVIAHEFSHILNGDMRLNIRLMGIIFGILVISMIGWIIFRSSIYSGRRLGSRNGRQRGGNPLPVIGLALYVIGYIGVFFGHLIKSAISRQREYLADASAVQFTRNPDGIAGALKKIGALSQGSRIDHPEAEEASHMFFGNALGSGLFGLMSTHPPLADRIKRIDPSFDGDFSKVRLEPPGRDREEPQRAAAAAVQARRERFRFNPAEAIQNIGSPSPEHLAFAAALLDAVPDPLRVAVHEPYGARAVIYALLLDADNAEVRQQQLVRLAEYAHPTVYQLTRRFASDVQRLGPEARLPLVELALPALRQMADKQYQDFQSNVRHLIEADRRVSLFEFALQRMLTRHLGVHFGRYKPPRVRYESPESLTEPVFHLLSALARVGHDDPHEAARAYHVGRDTLGWPGVPAEPIPRERSGLKAVNDALDTLAAATPQLKKQVLEACATTIGADERVTVNEAELLRAIADSLDCPMPPILAEVETE